MANTFSDQFQPYDPGPVRPEQMPVFARRPGLLTAICVVAIVLGVFAMLGALSSLGAIFSKNLVKMLQTKPPNMSDSIFEAQTQMQDAMLAVQSKFLPITLLFGAILLVLGVLLIRGGIRGLKLQERGRVALRRIALFGTVFEGLRLAVTLVIVMQTWTVMSAEAQNVRAAAQSPQDKTQAELFVNIQTWSFPLQIVFAVGWTTVKIGFFLGVAYYLSRPSICALYREASIPVAEFASG